MKIPMRDARIPMNQLSSSTEEQKWERLAQSIPPDRVCDVAYCLSVISRNGGSHEMTEDVCLAQAVVDRFKRLTQKVPEESRGGEYLFMVSQIVVSLARGINRKRDDRLSRLAAAGEQKQRELTQLSDMSNRSGFLRAALRLVAIAGLGAAIIRTFAPSLEHLEHANVNAMSLAAALALGLVSSYFSSWMYNARIDAIFSRYEDARWLAQHEYYVGARVEYERAKGDAAIAWRRLTGEEAQEWPDFGDVLASSLAEEREIYTLHCKKMQHPFGKFLSACRSLRKTK